MIPPVLFAGELSTVYLTARLHPPSSLLTNSPLLYNQQSYNRTHTSYPFTNFSFSFTAPLTEGPVLLQLGSLSPPSGSRCSTEELPDHVIVDVVVGK